VESFIPQDKSTMPYIVGDKMKRIIKKTKKMKEIEKVKGECIEEILRSMFVDQNKSIIDITNELDLSYATTISWLKQAGIYSRRLNI